MLKQIKNGILHGLGILIILGLGGISYAAFTGFAGLDATTGETLTETKWDNLVDAVKDNYSTSETLTNKTWLNGKAIYRISFDNTSGNLPAGYETITSISFSGKRVGQNRWESGATNIYLNASVRLYANIIDGAVAITNLGALELDEYYIHVEYTKTTDIAE